MAPRRKILVIHRDITNHIISVPLQHFLTQLTQIKGDNTLKLQSFIPLIFIIPFFVLLPVYITAEKEERFKKATTLKLILSGLCCICALTGYLADGLKVDSLRILIVLGLFWAVLGDFFLQYIRLDDKKYILGIVSFSITQLCLNIYLCMSYGLSWLEFIMTAIINIGVLILMVAQKWVLGSAQIPLTVYTLLLAFMTSKSILVMFDSNFTLSTITMALGAILFMTSDVLLGIWNYHSYKRLHANFCWITYFLGILLISLSTWSLL